jgi:hypothetical protein
VASGPRGSIREFLESRSNELNRSFNARITFAKIGEQAFSPLGGWKPCFERTTRLEAFDGPVMRRGVWVVAQSVFDILPHQVAEASMLGLGIHAVRSPFGS